MIHAEKYGKRAAASGYGKRAAASEYGKRAAAYEYGKRAAAYEVVQLDRFHQPRSISDQSPGPHTAVQWKKSLLGGEYYQEGFGQTINPGILVWLSIGAPGQVWGDLQASVFRNEPIEKRKAFVAFDKTIFDQTNILAVRAKEPRSQGRLSGPVKFVQSLLKTWGLTQDDALPLLGFEDSDRQYVSNLLNGNVALSGRDVKDRITYLLEIRKTLSALFLNEEVENEWLREKHAMLNNIAPMELMLEGTMENLLLVKEYVDTAAGK